MKTAIKGLLACLAVTLLLSGCVKPQQNDGTQNETGNSAEETATLQQNDPTTGAPGTQIGSETAAPAAEGSDTPATNASSAPGTQKTAAVTTAAAQTPNTESAAECLEDLGANLNSLGTLLGDLDDVSETDLEIPEP